MTLKNVVTSIFTLPLVAVEVTPLIPSKFCHLTEKHHSLISPELAKIQLKKFSLQLAMRITLDMSIPSTKVVRSDLGNHGVPFNSLQSGTIMIQRCRNSNQYHVMRGVSGEKILIVLIYSDDPSIFEPIPCYVRGHVELMNVNESRFVSPVVITKGTHVRVCSPKRFETSISSRNIVSHHFADAYLEESFYYNHAYSSKKASFDDENLDAKSKLVHFDINVLSNHDPDIIQSLALRMKFLLSTKHFISTSYDAHHLGTKSLHQHEEGSNNYKKNHKSKNMKFTIKCFHQNRRRKQMKDENKKSVYQKVKNENTKSIQFASIDHSHSQTSVTKQKLFPSFNTSPILREGGLTVYNSYNSSGKTTLITSIARHILHCSNIHILNPGLLFAKYGVSHADAALEGILYDLILGCALNDTKNSLTDNRICIILDGLDGFVGMRNNNENKSDPSFVTLNAIGTFTIFLLQLFQSASFDLLLHCLNSQCLFSFSDKQNEIIFYLQ